MLRRETDRLIKAGRVAINGEICTHGALVGDGDVVTIDGQVLAKERRKGVYRLSQASWHYLYSS